MGVIFASQYNCATRLFKMLRLIVCFSVFVAVEMATTTPGMVPSTTLGHMDGQIFYDFKHHVAMVVRPDGCFELHLNHQDMQNAQNPATQPDLETRIFADLASATDIHESGHHHIDHFTTEITTACMNLPVYKYHV